MTDAGFSNDVLRRAAAMGVRLRRAQVGDADDIAALMDDERVYAQLMQLPYADAAWWRERLGATSGADTLDLSLVVEAEGQVVASSGMHAMPRVRRRHAMMLGISVSAAWQGRGAGDLLMMAMCHHADQWLGILRLELTVFVDNERAIALYQKHGFEVEGRHHAYAFRQGRYEDVLAMARLHPTLGHALPLAPGQADHTATP
jgi:L-phenylalanine/L-methionine N-acetyltransferase